MSDSDFVHSVGWSLSLLCFSLSLAVFQAPLALEKYLLTKNVEITNHRKEKRASRNMQKRCGETREKHKGEKFTDEVYSIYSHTREVPGPARCINTLGAAADFYQEI